MKFTTPLAFIPKPQPPKNSWWATPSAQASRDEFTIAAKQERDRISGHPKFKGRTHNKGPE